MAVAADKFQSFAVKFELSRIPFKDTDTESCFFAVDVDFVQFRSFGGPEFEVRDIAGEFFCKRNDFWLFAVK